MAFNLSDFTNKKDFISKLNGVGQTSGYVLKTNGVTSYWAQDSGGGGASISVMHSESSNSGYFAGSITVNNVTSSFIVSPARISFNNSQSWQGVIRPYLELNYTAYAEMSTISSGISSTDTKNLYVYTGFNTSEQSAVLVPIITLYHSNTITGKKEAVPYLAMPYTLAAEFESIYDSAIPIEELFINKS